MRQPKFKFGDKVAEKFSDDHFVIDSIKSYSTGYYYNSNDKTRDWVPESILALYEEQKVKKLYAYMNEDLVIFSPIEAKAVRATGGLFDRCENFDITYGERINETIPTLP